MQEGAKMSKSDVIEIEGVVIEKLPNTMFQEIGRASCRERV